jgi:WD40 repeat protein
LNVELPTKSESDREPGLRLAVGSHALIGLLLIWLDPLASLFGDDAGRLIGLRETFPLLPCFGLFWMLVAAALISRQRFVIKGAIAAHCVTLLLPVLGCGLSAFLLLTPQPRSHMSLGPGPIVFVMVLHSVIISLFAGMCLFSLWRLLNHPARVRSFGSKRATGLAAFAVLMFALNARFVWSRTSIEDHREAEIERTAAHVGRVVAMVFSPDSAQVATGAQNFFTGQWIRIWDVGSGQMTQQLKVTRPVSDLVWSKDGKRLAAGCGEEPGVDAQGAVLVWDTSTWELVHEFESTYLSAVAMSSDSQFLAAAVSESTHGDRGTVVMLYELGKRDEIGFGNVPSNKNGTSRQITSLAFTHDGLKLIAGGRVGLTVWKLPFEGERPPMEVINLPGRYPEAPGQVTSMAVTADGAELVCVTSGTALLHGCSLADLQHREPSLMYQLGHLPPHEPMIAMSDEGQVLIADEQWPVVQCLSWPDGGMRHSITAEDFVSAIAISGDASVLAVGTSRRVRLHDGHTGEFLRELIKP